MSPRPTILWLRRDLRLCDHPAWAAALAQGGPVIPVFVLDPQTATLGAAPAWRLGQSLARLGDSLAGQGSRLILRRGDALACLRDLIAETGAAAVVWSRLYDPAAIARDSAIKAALTAQGTLVQSVNASLLAEPWTLQTKAGGFFKVYTPFWRAFAATPVPPPIPAPDDLRPPAGWPASDTLADWHLGAGLRRGAAVLARHAQIGETAAQHRLAAFVAGGLADYAAARDRLDLPGTSRLSAALAWGEISARTAWHATQRGPETYAKELVWREFAHHLLYHTPHIATRNWRADWDGFAWRGENPDARAWTRARTGIKVIDAAMRELYVTGTMHNRARMLVASFLTKHLLTDWRVGAAWFADCLVDWDPASNAMGWQWAAGSGPDAAPYFRVFNPDTQAEKFDPDGTYRRHWLTGPGAAEWHAAIPPAWGQTPAAAPLIDLAEGRARALAAFANKS